MTNALLFFAKWFQGLVIVFSVLSNFVEKHTHSFKPLAVINWSGRVSVALSYFWVQDAPLTLAPTLPWIWSDSFRSRWGLTWTILALHFLMIPLRLRCNIWFCMHLCSCNELGGNMLLILILDLKKKDSNQISSHLRQVQHVLTHHPHLESRLSTNWYQGHIPMQ